MTEPGLRCPNCGSIRLYVKDSRDSEDGIRRRRECQNCKHRFSTMERIEGGEVDRARSLAAAVARFVAGLPTGHDSGENR